MKNSVFGGPAWEWSDIRQQYYFHDFLKEQPDLNYRDPKVQENMMNVLKFWLDRGVDGFRIDAIIYLVENESFPDNPLSNISGIESDDYDYTLHVYNINQPETYSVVQNWTELFKTFGQQNHKKIFSTTEGYTDIDHQMEYYCNLLNTPIPIKAGE